MYYLFINQWLLTPCRVRSSRRCSYSAAQPGSSPAARMGLDQATALLQLACDQPPHHAMVSPWRQTETGLATPTARSRGWEAPADAVIYQLTPAKATGVFCWNWDEGVEKYEPRSSWPWEHRLPGLLLSQLQPRTGGLPILRVFSGLTPPPPQHDQVSHPVLLCKTHSSSSHLGQGEHPLELQTERS